MNLSRAVWKVFSVRRSEFGFALPLFLLYLLSGSFYAIGQIYTETLFLKAYGAQGLSRFFVYNGIALMAAGILYNYILLRFPLKRGYFFLIGLFSALIFLSFHPALQGHQRLPFYLFLGNYLFTFYLDIHFFNYSYQYLSIRNSKRLLPLFMGGGKLGGIIASLSLVALFKNEIIDFGGVWWLVNGALLVVPVLAMGFFFRGGDRRASLERNDLLPDMKIVERMVRRAKLSYSSPIFAISVLAVFVMAVVNLIAEYYFAVIITGSFPEKNDLAFFLSVYTFAADLATLLVQIFLTSRIIRALGVKKSNYIYPGSFMASLAFMVFSPGIAAGILLRFFRKNLSVMFRHPLFNVIIASAPRDRIAEVKSFIGGIVLPMGMIAGGCVVLIIYKKLPDIYGYVLAACAGALYIALTYFQNRAYVRSLKGQLSYDFTSGGEKKEALNLASIADDPAMVEMNLPLLDALFREYPDSEILRSLMPHFPGLSREAKETMLTVAATSRRDLREPLVRSAASDADPLIRGRALGMIAHFPYVKRLDLLQGYPENRLESEQIALELLMVDEGQAHGDGDLESSSFVLSLLSGEKGAGKMPPVVRRVKALRERVAAGFGDPAEFIILSQVAKPDIFLDDLADLALGTGNIIFFRALIPHAENLSRKMARKLLFRFRYAPMRLLTNFAVLSHHLTETDKAILLDYRFDMSEEEMAEYFSGDEGLGKLVLKRLGQKYGFANKSNYFKYLISMNMKPREDMLRFIRSENEAVRKIMAVRRMMCAEGPAEKDPCRRFLDLALRNEIDLRKQLLLKAVGVLTGTELDYIYESSIFLRDADVTGYILEFIESSGRALARESMYIFEEEALEAQARTPLSHGEANVNPGEVFLATISLMSGIAALTGYAAARVLTEMDAAPALEHIFRRFRKVEEDEMLSMLGKIIFLKGNRLFSDIDIDDLVRIARITRETEYPAGKIFIRENDPGEELFIVIDGEVEVLAGKKSIETLGKGSCIGELSIIDMEPRSASVKTKKKTRLLSINRKDFLLTLKENPVIAINVMRVITQRLRKSIVR